MALWPRPGSLGGVVLSGQPIGGTGENELSKGPSRNTRCNWPRRFWSEPRSEECTYREYESDEQRRRSSKASWPCGESHLWSGASLLLGHRVPLCSLVAPRRNHKSGPPNCTGYFVTDPNLSLFRAEEFFALTEDPINGLGRAGIQAESTGF